MGNLTHIDLFSGIGGFSLAARWTGFETVVFCENDEFCQKVLQERFGGFVADPKCDGYSKRYSQTGRTVREGKSRGLCKSSRENCPVIIPDIRDFDGTRWQGATLLTGGFPCQPFSVAGRRGGKEDDRYLWPEMFRVIKESKPRWILAENVAGIIPMALDTVLSDLEAEGYETGAVVVPACAVNAPHRRDRVWIIAHARRVRPKKHEKQTTRIEQPNQDASDSEKRESRKSETWNRREGVERGNWQIPWIEVATSFCGIPHGFSDWLHRNKRGLNATISKRITKQNLPYLWAYIQSKAFREQIGGCNKIPIKENVFAVLWEYFIESTAQLNLSTESEEASWALLRNVWIEKKAGYSSQRWEYQEQQIRKFANIVPSLSHEVALETKQLVQEYSKNRVKRLKALGNAIVPAVAYEILRGIAEVSKC